jgi:hypothetical protein
VTDKVKPLRKNQKIEEILNPINGELVALLERMTEAAKAGELQMAVVAYMDDGALTYEQSGVEDHWALVGHFMFLVNSMMFGDDLNEGQE